MNVRIYSRIVIEKIGGAMRKGLFWVIEESGERKLLTFSAECDKDGVVNEGQPAYNSRKGDSLAHKNSWETATKDYPREIRNKQWNHFPRGRVEIANGKATVFHNPSLSEWSVFEAAVIRDFEIEGLQTRFIPDGSKHYRYGGVGFHKSKTEC
jgi:hypothetical protein